MLIIAKGAEIEDTHFRPCIDGGVATYAVSGFSVEDLACLSPGDLVQLHEICTDDILDDGHLLTDISYRFLSVDRESGTATILVRADASEWLKERKESKLAEA